MLNVNKLYRDKNLLPLLQDGRNYVCPVLFVSCLETVLFLTLKITTYGLLKHTEWITVFRCGVYSPDSWYFWASGSLHY